MSENDHPTGASLSRLTTPTWEMELLISGVTVFALLQLPGVMDHAWLGLRPRLDADWEALSRLLFTYSKMSVLTLAVAFVLHLILRGYWIALVGMNSIYPQGVDWNRLKIGPIQRRMIEHRGIKLVDRIETADNRSSIVFALGITLTLVMVAIVLTVSLCFAVSSVLAWLLGWHWLLPNGTFMIMAMLALPYAIAHQLDRRLGSRLASDGWTARAITGIYALYARVGYGSDSNPTMKLLQSHIGERKVSAATFISIVFVGAIVLGQLTLQQDNVTIGDYAQWPDAELGATDSLIEQHYRDEAGQTNALLPTIDSMFPSGDYLSLIVPFDPKLHPALLAAACPTVWHSAAKLSQRMPLLHCMAQLQQLTLDGQALDTQPLRFYSDPRTAQQGVILIVPTGNLASGEHVLSLKRARTPDASKSDPGPDRYQIAFWK